MSAFKNSGHWYAEDGTLVETVPTVDGTREIAPTLRHARVSNYAPGVTTICGMADRPELVDWRVRRGIEVSLDVGREEGETSFDYARRVSEIADQQVRDLADAGTLIHASIEAYFRGDAMDVDPRHAPHVEAVERELMAMCGPQQWRAEVRAVSPLGYGTIIDLVSDEWIIDTKTKDGSEAALRALKPYESYQMQLAAGDRALPTTTTRKAGILYVSRSHEGVACGAGVTPDEMSTAWEKFKCLLRFWQLRNKYRPSWAKE